VGVTAGAGLLLMPERMFLPNSQIRLFLLEHNLVELLNLNLKIEKPLYRHHRIFGTTLTACIIVLLILLGKTYHRLYETALWNQILGVKLAMAFGWIFSILSLGISLTFIIRPSALKRIETFSNRWIGSSKDSNSTSDLEVKGINLWILMYPRQTGLLLLLFGIACVGTAYGTLS